MGIIEILMIGIGLSMDAFAVSLSNGLVCPISANQKLKIMPLFFWCVSGSDAVVWLFCR